MSPGAVHPAVPAAPAASPPWSLEVAAAARALIGWRLTSHKGGAPTAGVIVETEAYGPLDPASHAFRGPTSRNRAMFGPPGHAYVYLSYGLHWCLNVTCGPPGHGAAVLLRALEPLLGRATMARRRRRGGGAQSAEVHLLCAGPGRLTQALGVDGGADGRPLGAGGALFLSPPPADAPRVTVVAAPRVGIRRAREVLWRFAAAESAFVSRPRPTLG